MKQNTIASATIIFTLALLTGCASTKSQSVQVVNVPVLIPCNINVPEKPAMPFTDEPLSGDVFTDSKKALAEIEQRKGYEIKLETAISECNKQ